MRFNVTKSASRAKRFISKNRNRHITKDKRRAKKTYRTWARQELKAGWDNEDLNLDPRRKSHTFTERDVV